MVRVGGWMMFVGVRWVFGRVRFIEREGGGLRWVGCVGV